MFWTWYATTTWAWWTNEIGQFLILVGAIFFVCEWRNIFAVEGNDLARQDLVAHLDDWRAAADDTSRAASVRRMQEALTGLRSWQRAFFDGYVRQLATIRPDDAKQLDALERAFLVGTPIEIRDERPKRRRLVAWGVFFVVVGTIMQMIGTQP